MGVKDELKALVDDLSDEEAASVLAGLRAEAAGPTPEEQRALLNRLRASLGAMPTRPAGTGTTELVRPGSPEALRELFDRFALEGPVMTEEEWNEFARAVDSHRPHRPVFFP